MKPVFQDRLDYGTGNCVAACVASIFEVTLDSLRWMVGYNDDLLRWTEENRPDLHFNAQDFCTNYRIEWGFPYVEGVGTGRWAYDYPKSWKAAPHGGYWMGVVPSQSLILPVEDPYYPLRATHAVVMRGRRLVHDPNPNNSPYSNPQILQRIWWSRKDGKTQV